MANPDWPHLGFNPVPGSTEMVGGLHRKLAGCAKVLEDTRDLVAQLMDGSYWKGDAAVAFREELEGGPLPLNLKNAARSLRKAAQQVRLWESELDEFRRRARRLDEEAKNARAAVGAATGRATVAGDAPALQKKEGTAYEDARAALHRADAALGEAEADLARILRRARGLAEEHERQAQYRADRIRDATKKLVPHEPGSFDRALDWLGENLPDVLSGVAAVVGLVALFVLSGGTAAAVLLLAAAALSASALTMRLLEDPTLRASLWDGFTKGEFDTDFWSNLVTVGGDALGTLPGVGAAGKGAAAALRATGETGTVGSLGQRVAGIGTGTMEHARSFAALDNPLLHFTIRGARAEQTIRSVEVTSASVGVATAGFGLTMKAVDADDDGIKDGSVAGIDGVRLGVDGGALVDVVRQIS